MAPVVETAVTRRDGVSGSMRSVTIDLTAVDNTDTWDPGLAQIRFFTFTPTTAGNNTQWGATIAQGTGGGANQARVTFVIESGTLAGIARAEGY